MGDSRKPDRPFASSTILRPDAPDYPAVLHRCAEDGCPPAVTAWGSLYPLSGKLLGFFCSIRTPGDVILKTYDLARKLRDFDLTLVGGFQSPMEREFLDFYLRGVASVVICPARGIGTRRIPRTWQAPLEEGRLVFLSFFNANVRRPTAVTAARRNAQVTALADQFLIPYAEPGGKIERLCKTVLAQGKRVMTLVSPDNAHLIDLGAVALSASDFSSLRHRPP